MLSDQMPPQVRQQSVQLLGVTSDLPSLVNRLRRSLDNPSLSVRPYYRPVAESLVSAFRGLPMRLIMDTTKQGFNARLLTVSIAYRKRSLPLAWSVHRGQKGWVAVKEQIALLRQVGVAGIGPIGTRPLLIAGVLAMIFDIQLISIGLLGEMVRHFSFRPSEEYAIRRILDEAGTTDDRS